MNLDKLSEKLNKIDYSLKNDNSYETLLKKLKEEPEIKQEYYNSLDPLDRDYQKKNDDYKKLISGFSQSYLELCEWYVGPELPINDETFLDNKDSINILYFMFLMSMFIKSN
tara:strand:- start:205 stop:540 length:336 start_codon:yes stop_codon:yes gene_type:complete